MLCTAQAAEGQHQGEAEVAPQALRRAWGLSLGLSRWCGRGLSRPLATSRPEKLPGPRKVHCSDVDGKGTP